MGARTAAERLKVEVARIVRIMDSFFRKFSRLKQWLHEVKRLDKMCYVDCFVRYRIIIRYVVVKCSLSDMCLRYSVDADISGTFLRVAALSALAQSVRR